MIGEVVRYYLAVRELSSPCSLVSSKVVDEVTQDLDPECEPKNCPGACWLLCGSVGITPCLVLCISGSACAPVLVGFSA